MKPLLVDPSGRGGIVRYTRGLARALSAAGASPTVVVCRSIPREDCEYRVRRWLPKQRWGRPWQLSALPAFYAGRAGAWLFSAAAVQVASRLERIGVIHFQAPINRRLDLALLQRVRRRVPVVWTAHDVLPPEPAAGDEERFASIYRAVDLVIVHGEKAAQEVRRLAGVEPTTIEHVPDYVPRIPRSEARRLLGLPDSERVLGAFGFVRPYKGYGLLADAWERLGSSAPLLLVMGEVVDDESQQVLDRLERTGRAIVRRGYASEDDLHLAFSAADGLLLPYVAASESGLLHMSRAAGVPVLASDAPQLAALVRATSAGVVLSREVGVWAGAVTGPLPPPPSTPPPPDEIGRAHLGAYEEARRRAHARSRRP